MFVYPRALRRGSEPVLPRVLPLRVVCRRGMNCLHELVKVVRRARLDVEVEPVEP